MARGNRGNTRTANPAAEPVNKSVEESAPDPGVKKLAERMKETAKRWQKEQDETLANQERHDEATRRMLDNARAAREKAAKEEE